MDRDVTASRVLGVRRGGRRRGSANRLDEVLRGADAKRSLSSTVLAHRLALGAMVAIIACASLSSCQRALRDESTPSRARVLPDGRAVSLVAMRLPPAPARWLTASRSVRCHLSLDPDLVDVASVARYSVWSNASGEWARIATGGEREAELVVDLDDGRHGLWFSVIRADDTEALLPTPFDEPLAWVYVDATPPVVEWILPAPAPGEPSLARSESDDESSGASAIPGEGSMGETIADASSETAEAATEDAPADDPTDDASGTEVAATGSEESSEPAPGANADGRVAVTLESNRLPLAFRIHDAQFGSDPIAVEWSRDGGTTWGRIATRPAKSGEKSLVWDLPANVPSHAELRVRARDAAGHETIAHLSLRIHGPLSEPPLTGETAVAKVGSETGGEIDLDEASVAVASASSRPGTAAAESDDGGATAKEVALAPLEIAPLAACARPGDRIRIEWTKRDGMELESSARVLLERRTSAPAGGDWAFASEATVGDGALEWTVPADAEGSIALRAAILDASARRAFEIPLAEEIAIDGTPPRVTFKEVPRLIGGVAKLSIEVDAATPAGEPSCSALESVRVWTRAVGQRFWDPLPADRVKLSAEILELDLGRLPEGECEVFLAGRDALGNEAPEPLPDAKPTARFALDRTPPRISGRELVLDWVAGSSGEVLVDIDASDIAPPIIVEARGDGEDFREIVRLADASIPQGRIGFEVPARSGDLEIRVRVSDRAGNVAQETFGPRPIALPARLESLGVGAILIAGASERLSWKAAPIALERDDEWEIALEHQAGGDGPWLAIGSGLRLSDEHHYWRVPAADGLEHRIRLIARRNGNVASIDTSAAFRIHALEVAEEEKKVEIAPASLQAAREASAAYAKLVSRGGDPESTEPMIVEAKFREALALDGRNYHASFGLAQFLRFMDPENTRDEVIRLLETTLAVAPRHADAREELGAAQLAAGRWADAERSLARALEIRSSGRTLYNLGLAVLYQGRGGEARKHLESALGFLGEDGLDEGNVRGYLVFTYLVEGNVEGARSLYARDRGRIAEGLKAAIESRLQ